MTKAVKVKVPLRIQHLTEYWRAEKERWRIYAIMPSDTFPADADFKGQVFNVNLEVKIDAAPGEDPRRAKPSKATEARDIAVSPRGELGQDAPAFSGVRSHGKRPRK